MKKVQFKFKSQSLQPNNNVQIRKKAKFKMKEPKLRDKLQAQI